MNLKSRPPDRKPELILASHSPRRRELLALLGLPFRVLAAQTDESNHPAEATVEMVARLALAKARDIAAAHPSALVLGFDTSVALDTETLGKPADAEQARAMLRRMRGRPHIVYTGIALVENGRETVVTARTLVRMRDYTNEELAAYVACDNPMDKAGAYAIQSTSFHPVASWDGCYANVMGLPLCHLVHALQTWGITPPADVPTACQSYTGQPCTAFPAILQQ